MLRRGLSFIYESGSGEAWVNIDSSLCAGDAAIDPHRRLRGPDLRVQVWGGGKSLIMGHYAGGLFLKISLTPLTGLACAMLSVRFTHAATKRPERI